MARPDDPDVRLLRALRRAAAVGAESLHTNALVTATALPNVGALAERLAVLRGAGYEITGNTSLGWHLAAAPNALIADDVLATLPPTPTRLIGREIVVFEETNSTNDLARRAGDEGAAEGLVIFAEKQRAGRGRLGRMWESRPRLGLWFSVLLRPALVPIERWSELTFCAALAVAETAEAQTRLPTRIKWPNDVLLNGRKVAGILLECHHRQEPGFVVVGIGVNVLQCAEDFDPQLRERAGSLALMSATSDHAPLDRRVVAASLLQSLDRLYAAWPQGFSSIMQCCEQRGCVPPKRPD